MRFAVLIAITLTGVADAQSADWEPHRDPENGYTVKFPGDPVGAATVRDLGDMKVRVSTKKFVVEDAGRAFMVAVTPLPKGDGPAAKILDQAVTASAANLGGMTVVPGSRKPVELAGADAGRRFEAAAGKSRFLIHAYLAGGRVYQLYAGWKSDDAAGRKDAEAFAASFRLLKK